MALATRVDSAATDTGPRAKAVRKARRHSALVRVLKVVLPALGLGVVAVYSMLFAEVASLAPTVDRALVPKILPEHLAMQNPRYEGYTKDGGSYLFMADSASQSLTNTNLVSLTAIKGTIIDGGKAETSLTAARGEFDTKTNTLTLSEGIDVVSGNGLKAKLERATVLAKENIITSDAPVLVETPAGTIRAKRMTIRQKLREATFADDVVANLKATEKPAPPPGAPAAGGQSLFGGAGQPIEVTARRLDVNDAASTATFSGEVKAVQGDSTITTPELTIAYEGNGAGVKPAPGAPSAKLRQILAAEPVVITRGANERITAARAEFDAGGDRAFLAGNVVITALPDRRAEGDRAEFNARTNTALLTGAVSVTQAENVLRGRRLVLDRANGRTELSAPAENATPAGRVTAHLYQKGAKAKLGAPVAPTPAAEASGGFGGGAFKTDASAPVDIEADTLDVNDPARIATFRGAVSARQGEIVITAQEMQAHYSGQMGIADQGQSQGSGATEITHIDARGKVAVTAKDGQTATGDWAKFDVKSNKAVLGGRVELTQGRNVVAGNRLTIDMATGESVIGNVAAAPGAPAQSRPQAVLYPKEMRDKAKGALAPAVKALDALKDRDGASNAPLPPEGSGGGWNPTTRP